MMAIRRITFDRFDLGIDHRKAASVSDANRLLDMTNAHVTTGRATEKRYGLSHVTTLEPGTAGLSFALGKLNTFYAGNTPIAHAHPLFVANRVTGDINQPIAKVWFCDVFNNFVYVAVEYADGEVRHHYLDGSTPTQIADTLCPHTKALVKAASKVFAVGVNGDVVRYCATGDCRDWSTPEDAGFLPTGLNAAGDRVANALGMYGQRMVVLSRDAAQIWVVDPDPTAMKLDDVVANVGSSFPESLATVSGDLYFLSDYGFRSITTRQFVTSLADVDIGSPVDEMVRRAIRGRVSSPVATFDYGGGRYLCAIGKEIFVYAVSQTSKIAAWSRYELPIAIDAWASLDGALYIRSGDTVYRLDEEATADELFNAETGVWERVPFPVRVQLPYMDFKAPGELKHIVGLDLVVDGECRVSVGYDETNARCATSPVRVIGNTRPGGVLPIECVGTAFSFILTNRAAGVFRLNAITAYYETMGAL
ncbi:MAG: hypothetical protein LBK01_06830 [Burkholderiaceae bacterium]|jgi:hypothetical protein|nr:hypothetical protein [Burkholderiaceae bacterium]